MRELQAYIPIGQDIYMMTYDSLPIFIKIIKKELAATRRSLPFVTSEYAHNMVERRLGEDEALHLAIKCSLAADQPTHFSDDPSNKEEAMI